MLAQLAATVDWINQLDDNYLTPQFMKSAAATKFLGAQYGELKSILTELGMAK